MRKRLLFALITISTCFAIFTSCNEQPHEHLFDEWVTIKQADCYETGLQKSICECGKLDFREVEKLPHTEAVYEAIEPTCTSIGLTEGKYCSVCNTVLVTQTPIAAKEHTAVTDDAIVPTCTSIGLTEGKHCSVCSTVLVAQTPVAAKGHTDVIDAAVAPTCTSIGLTEGKHCSACNTVLVAQTAVAPQGHKYSQDIVSGKNLKSLPTCTEAAIYYEICACGARSGNTFVNGSINKENHTSTVIVHEYAEKDASWHVSRDVWQCCGQVARNPINEGHEMKDDVCILCEYTMYKDFVITSSNRSKIGFTGAENESLVIPEKFQDTDGTWYKVVGISEGAFFKCENLTNVTLPDTIKYIDSSVFAYCTSLESCVIPDGITNLYSTFRDCTSLKSVTLPDSITSIGPYTFFNCNQLTEITLPKNLRSLDDSALRWCSSLTTLVLPEKVSALGYAAFELNTGLTSITIPKSLSFIDECVFSSCKNLRKIDYQGTQEDWHNITFVNGWHLNTPVVFIQCTDGIVYSVYQQQSGSGSVSVRS